jgi:hypothetical protein
MKVDRWNGNNIPKILKFGTREATLSRGIKPPLPT